MNFLKKFLKSAIAFIDSDHFPEGREQIREKPDKFELKRFIPFLILHLGCIGIIWVGWSLTAVIVAVVLYFVRMFFITGFYHRYFCHRAYKTSRAGQFMFGLLGLTAVQRGPLWWAGVHRHHHSHADEETDIHSPSLKGFWWSHIGWMTSERNYPTNYSLIKDLSRYPELVFLDRFDLIGPLLLAGSLYLTGMGLQHFAPGLHTTGPQLLIWGFFVSTVFLFHGTCCINSFAHIIGNQRYDNGNDSKNSLILSFVTLGEGWHNNHHQHQYAAKQGFYWWEIDITFYTLKVLSWMGIIWSLRPVPEEAYVQVPAANPEITPS
ncbi:MAG: acyl-CoA desaturase [Chthoniobacterales bacterium]